jgi:hypothetical protein
MIGTNPTPLTFTHLRFQARARTTIKLGEYQGAERLRDALAQVMLRAVCPAQSVQRAERPSPEHAAVCPACWLLAAQTDPGAVRRVYSLAGPQPPLDTLAPNQPFQFTITLFGDGFRFLPYFVLAASAMGDTGVGPGRGKFEIVSIHAVNPLTGMSHAILSEGEKVVRPQSLPIGWNEAEAVAREFPSEADVRVRFLSPTRLIDSDSLVKAPDFGIFFRRLLERADELSKQHNSGERRAPEEVSELYALADQVRLIEQSTQWIELWGPSGRTGRSTPMGGFVGFAVYRSKHWDKLLPWLLLGQGVQVGKLTAKGNGVFQVDLLGRSGYWV